MLIFQMKQYIYIWQIWQTFYIIMPAKCTLKKESWFRNLDCKSEIRVFSDCVSVIQVLFFFTSYTLTPALLTVEQKYSQYINTILSCSSTLKVVKSSALWISNYSWYVNQQYDVLELSECTYAYIYKHSYFY